MTPRMQTKACSVAQSCMLSFCNIFDLLTSRTREIAWCCPVLKPDF